MLAAWEDDPGAAAWFDASVELFQTLDDLPTLAGVLYDLGTALAYQADYPRAERALARSLKIAQALDDPVLIARATARLGTCAAFQGDTERARPLLETSLAWMRQRGDTQFSAALMMYLGAVYLGDNSLSRAETLFDETVTWVRHIRRHVPYPLIGLAGVALGRGDPERAARLLGAAEALDVALIPATQFCHDDLVEAVRSRLDGDDSCHAWARGRQMSLDEAIEFACLAATGADTGSHETSTACKYRFCAVGRTGWQGNADMRKGRSTYPSR